MSRQAHVCGAATGAIMDLNVKHSRNSPEELRAHTYNRVVELLKQFQENFGSIHCKEL